MSSTATKLFCFAAAIAATVIVARVLVVREREHRRAIAQQAAREKALRDAELDRLARQSAPVPETASTPTPEIPPAKALPAVTEPRSHAPAPRPSIAPLPIANTPARRELQDPMARAALSLVGVDRDAEAYWMEAVFDSSLPDQEREDLMEDLNEDGLSDPRHPGPQDLPMILNRLALIEDLAPYSDDFMLLHWGEAYKDLLNLAALARGEGRPVR